MLHRFLIATMNRNNDYQPYLPPCVLKEELASLFFKVSLEWMWLHILTDELLNEWGYDQRIVKKSHRLSFHLTRKIYVHFLITDLKRPYSDAIAEEIRKLNLSQTG